MRKDEYLAKREAMVNEAQELIDSGKIDEANAKMEEIKKITEDYENAAKAEANLAALTNAPQLLNLSGADTIFLNNTAETDTEEIYDSVEYRRAFMNYVINGKAIPDKFVNASTTTKTTDVGTVISPTIINRIVEKMESIGMILPLVTKTAYASGAIIPTSNVKPVATWVTENGTSDKQKKTTGQIDIKGFKLRCAISMSLETSVMTLQIFETVFVNSVSEAMVKAQEKAFIYGTGVGQPKGVLTETVEAGQNIEITKADDPTYKTLIEAEAAIPLAYESGAVWNMTKKTFMKFIGMVDANKQPIARVNYGINGQPERILLGRRVVLNDYMTSLGATITEDTVVAFLFDWSEYLFNTNYNMTIKMYEDNDTEEQVTKAVMICDGKVIDKNSLVTITKKFA